MPYHPGMIEQPPVTIASSFWVCPQLGTHTLDLPLTAASGHGASRMELAARMTSVASRERRSA